MTWYGAGEIIAWNNYPTEYSAAEAIQAWMDSPGHHGDHDVDRLQLRRLRRRPSRPDGQALLRRASSSRGPTETGAWATIPARPARRRSAPTASRVTIRWAGDDTRLQVLTSGLRYFEIQRRVDGGAWHAWGTTHRDQHDRDLAAATTCEVRVRARDKAGNWGAWKVITVKL